MRVLPIDKVLTYAKVVSHGGKAEAAVGLEHLGVGTNSELLHNISSVFFDNPVNFKQTFICSYIMLGINIYTA